MRIPRPVALAVATAAIAGSGLLLTGTANAATTNADLAAHPQAAQVAGVLQSYSYQVPARAHWRRHSHYYGSSYGRGYGWHGHSYHGESSYGWGYSSGRHGR